MRLDRLAGVLAVVGLTMAFAGSALADNTNIITGKLTVVTNKMSDTNIVIKVGDDSYYIVITDKGQSVDTLKALEGKDVSAMGRVTKKEDGGKKKWFKVEGDVQLASEFKAPIVKKKTVTPIVVSGGMGGGGAMMGM